MSTIFGSSTYSFDEVCLSSMSLFQESYVFHIEFDDMVEIWLEEPFSKKILLIDNCFYPFFM